MSDPHTLVGGWTLADRYRDLLLKRIRLREKRGVIRLPPRLECLRSKDKQENLLARKRWIVNVQTPPDRCVGPDAALGYLAGYVRGGVIGNGRMVADDGERVTYWIKEYCEDGARKDETILGVDFVKWFTWNILPFRFWRVRSKGVFGGV